VAAAAQDDSAFLEDHGFTLKWLRRDPLIYTILAERAGETTKMEWMYMADVDGRRTKDRPYLLTPRPCACDRP